MNINHSPTYHLLTYQPPPTSRTLLHTSVSRVLRYRGTLTELVQHLVTFIKHKVFDVLEVEMPGADKGKDTSRRPDDDVRTVVAQRLLVLLHQHAAEEHGDLHTVHVLGEALVLLADLESQLTGVAHHQH